MSNFMRYIPVPYFQEPLHNICDSWIGYYNVFTLQAKFDRNENVLQPTTQQDQPSGRMHKEVKVSKGKAMSFANVVSVYREGKREISIQFTG